MKQLQSNFTTPEQSKRLLELGIPADSADCYYSSINQIMQRLGKFELCIFPNDTTISSVQETADEEGYTIIPCWSVGRLIAIMKICSKSRYALRGLFSFLEECEADECMFQVMDYFEICNYQFDFSKLEE